MLSWVGDLMVPGLNIGQGDLKSFGLNVGLVDVNPPKPFVPCSACTDRGNVFQRPLLLIFCKFVLNFKTGACILSHSKQIVFDYTSTGTAEVID